MPLMLSSLYDALLEAGASPEASRKAAEEAALYETRLTRIDAAVDSLNHRVTVLIWAIGLSLSVGLAVSLLILNWLWQILQRLPH
jgi:hypothetical protein